MKALLQEVARLEKYIPQSGLLCPEVSGGSVGWQVEHCLLVVDRVVEALEKSDPAAYQKHFSWKLVYVNTFGKIPRNKIRAPHSVQPSEHITEENLRAHFASTMGRLPLLSALRRGQYFDHPFLGQVKLAQAIRFLAVHTRHHLRIIEEIIEAGKKA